MRFFLHHVCLFWLYFFLSFFFDPIAFFCFLTVFVFFGTFFFKIYLFFSPLNTKFSTFTCISWSHLFISMTNIILFGYQGSSYLLFVFMVCSFCMFFWCHSCALCCFLETPVRVRGVCVNMFCSVFNFLWDICRLVMYVQFCFFVVRRFSCKCALGKLRDS